MVREGRFREDLLFRLNVVRLHLPPLRSRGDDVRLLLDHFLNTFISQFKKPMKGFSAKAHRILMDYSFPGNVRELRNIVEYAVNICQEDQVQPKHLPAYLTDPKLREEQSAQDERKRDALAAGLETSQGGSQGGQETLGEKETDLNWASVEKKMIMDAMIKAKGRRSTAAALLGWGRSTLWRKMKQYGIAS
jgi:DNA-binding NtrC family response regulator